MLDFISWIRSLAKDRISDIGGRQITFIKRKSRFDEPGFLMQFI